MNVPISLTGVEFFSEDGKKSFYVCGCFKEKELLKENEELKKENKKLKEKVEELEGLVCKFQESAYNHGFSE